MNIVMFTNTFSPHVGGVARSVSGLAQGLRASGHKVLVVAPTFPDMPESEIGVIRIPALQNFAGTDFSVPIPASRALEDDIDAFAPDIIHAHHPFLLGGTAVRFAALRNLPLVFTYHTHYELYSHYAKQDSPMMMRLALGLALGYCNLCEAVIAPSQSLAAFLHQHNVAVPIEVVPTGVKSSEFGTGDGAALRAELGIVPGSFIVGHVGRLALEKNLGYLIDAIIIFLTFNPDAHFLVAGGGAMESQIVERFAEAGLGKHLHMVGVVQGAELANVYAAMDVFAFSSHSETQGLVLAEAMTAGTPVVALDASGVREIVDDRANGRLLASEASPAQFAKALSDMATSGNDGLTHLRIGAATSAQQFTHDISIARTIALYRNIIASNIHNAKETDHSLWETALRSLAAEWEIIGNVAHAVGDAVLAPPEHRT